MINKLAALFIIACISFTSKAQQDTAVLLKEPTSWTFEKFKLPPGFATAIPYHGVEELRFSPGMFSKDSVSYFTYAFAAQLDNVSSISQSDVKNYLLLYFKGLCGSTAKSRKLDVDTGKITVSVERKKDTGPQIIYNASLNIFGVFADGAPVKLNMEVKIMKDPSANNIFLVFIASPHDKTDIVWKELYKVQQDFEVPKR